MTKPHGSLSTDEIGCQINSWRIRFDYSRLAKAIATRDRSYGLLMWISDAVDKGLIPVSRVAHHSGGPDAAHDWIQRNYSLIPQSVRPDEDDLFEFAAFFSTYLTSSFDVFEKPGTRGEGGVSPHGCTCELCVRIVNAPHLRAKKLFAQDKRRADWLMEEYLLRFATEKTFIIDASQARRIVVSKATHRELAYLTYGHWLIERLSGKTDGPAILVLWRRIAWDPRGGIRRAFKLHIDDFRSAEHKILLALQQSQEDNR